MDRYYPQLSFTAPQVAGLDGPTQGALNELVVQWARCMPRNIERMVYLDLKNKLKDLAVALPPSLVEQLGVVMGWPPKAVYELANRIVFERVATADETDRDPFGLMSMLEDNRFAIEFPQSVASSLAQSVAFVSSTPGVKAEGEPDVIIAFHSALWATGLWSRRTRSLRAGMIVNDVDAMGVPTRMTVMVPGETVVCVKGPSSSWYVEAVYRNHLASRIPMEALPFRPTLERPFGRSRIDRAVISVTDRAVRAASRLEVHSELFSAMKLILLGADESAFQGPNGEPVPLWSFYMGRLNALSKDEDGDLPKLEQISSQSPEPHIAVLRQLAAEFSGHTGVPLGSLGIATDNPESAGAKQEARQDIVGDAENQHIVYGAALKKTFENAVMLRDGLSTPPPEMRALQLKWRPPTRPTLSALADAGSKQVAALPELAESEVGLELLGLDAGQIERYLADKRRARAGERLQALAAVGQQRLQGASAAGQDAPTSGTEDAQVLKAKFDALGVAIRAGVEPSDAAARVGLAGIKFTGAVPSSLRMLDSEAAGLEEK